MMFGKRKKLVSSKIKEIKTHLQSHDKWVDIIEWGVGKETYIEISKTVTDATWYKVLVQLDHTFTCKCPTIERAVEFADIYEDLIYKLYLDNGWPSWHSKNEL